MKIDEAKTKSYLESIRNKIKQPNIDILDP